MNATSMVSVHFVCQDKMILNIMKHCCCRCTCLCIPRTAMQAWHWDTSCCAELLRRDCAQHTSCEATSVRYMSVDSSQKALHSSVCSNVLTCSLHLLCQLVVTTYSSQFWCRVSSQAVMLLLCFKPRPQQALTPGQSLYLANLLVSRACYLSGQCTQMTAQTDACSLCHHPESSAAEPGAWDTYKETLPLPRCTTLAEIDCLCIHRATRGQKRKTQHRAAVGVTAPEPFQLLSDSRGYTLLAAYACAAEMPT